MKPYFTHNKPHFKMITIPQGGGVIQATLISGRRNVDSVWKFSVYPKTMEKAQLNAFVAACRMILNKCDQRKRGGGGKVDRVYNDGFDQFYFAGERDPKILYDGKQYILPQLINVSPALLRRYAKVAQEAAKFWRKSVRFWRWP